MINLDQLSLPPERPQLKIDRYVYLASCTFDRLDLTVYCNNRSVDLTFTQLKILNFLCRRPNNIYSCADIAVGLGNGLTAESVRTHIHRMKSEKRLQRSIETVHTVGYRVIGATEVF